MDGWMVLKADEMFGVLFMCCTLCELRTEVCAVDETNICVGSTGQK